MSVYRYIKLKPVKAPKEDEQAVYFWSSYQWNAHDKKNGLLIPHFLYTRLGINEKKRQLAYRGLFVQQIEGRLLEDTRQATSKKLALGNEYFFANIVSLTGTGSWEKTRQASRLAQ
mgnify:CR=1 FL=1